MKKPLVITLAAGILVLCMARGWAGVEGDSPCPLVDAGLDQALLNFHKLNSCVLRGGRPTPAGIKALAAAKVRTVIDLQGGDLLGPDGHGGVVGALVPIIEAGETDADIRAEGAAVSAEGMVFVSAPLDSMRAADAAEAAAIDAILVHLHDPSAQPVFVHCAHGNDRTGLVAALYRVRYQGWSLKDAHDEMVQLGHHGFIDHLVTGAMDTSFWKLAPGYATEFKSLRP